MTALSPSLPSKAPLSGTSNDQGSAFAGTPGWVRPSLALLALTGLAVSLRNAAWHTDSVAVFANAVTCSWLGAVVAALALNRRLGLSRTLVLIWLAIGILRAIVSIWGVPVGWILTESIAVQDRFAASQTHVTNLSFGAGEVPAHLINDNSRFNFYAWREGDPDRTKLPVTLVAKTFVAGEGALKISSSSPIRITVGSEVTDLRPPIIDYVREISVAQETPVEIAMAPTAVDKAALRVQPVGLELYSDPTAGPLMTVHRWLGRIAGLLDILVIAVSCCVVALAIRRRLARIARQRLVAVGLVSLVLFLSSAGHLLTWFSQHDSLLVLSGGDDWLTYETFARDIQNNSPLMLMGQTLGKAQLFYYQPLYPYMLAIGHFVVGESVQGLILLQLLGAGLVVFVAFLTIPEGLIPTVAFLLVALGTGIVEQWMQLAEKLLSENLLLVMFALLLLVVSRLKTAPSFTSMALVGTILGIAGLARSTSWVAVPFVAFLLLRGMPRRDLPMRLAVLMLPVVLLAASIPVRNLIAAGTPAPLPTSGSINLYMGNVPTGRKLPGEPWVSLSKTYDPRLVSVAEAVVDVPNQVAKKIADKTIYVLGFPRSMDADYPVIFWPVLSLWILAPLGFLTRKHSRLAWLSLVLAVTHALSLVLVFPNNYYYRLEMPATLPLLIWDTIAINDVLGGLVEPSWPGRQLKRVMSGLGTGLSDEPA